jgi:hypothetical protein
MSRELSRYSRGQEASSRLIQGSKEASLPDHYHVADAPVKTDTMSVLAENLPFDVVGAVRRSGMPLSAKWETVSHCLFTLGRDRCARVHDAPERRPANLREMFRVS